VAAEPTARSATPTELLDAARTGDRRALARLLSLVERGGAPAGEVGGLVHPLGGQAHTVGITGAPGSGKSTLVSALLGVVRAADEAAAVLAIDPTSPFTGGAILGDRVRMSDHVLDEGVFIRSMATRGHLGGLSLATPAAVRVLDAVGFEWVVIETVGVGQVEVEIAGAADTTVVVVNPGWGDAIQANKAGLMEIADVFAVNKADRPGAADTVRDIEQMLDLSHVEGWRPPVVTTTATSAEGAIGLWDAVRQHREHLLATGELERRRAGRLRDELRGILVERLRLRADELLATSDLTARVVTRELDPWAATDELLDSLD
jgi:LAO/AO transport system kinase